MPKKDLTPSPLLREPWPGVPRAGAWRTLAADTPLGTIEGPFVKLLDEEIQTEIEALRLRSEALA